MDITTQDDRTQAIYDYLYEHGRMSGRDICRACGVDAVDVDMAVDCGAIVRTAPAHGGVAPWYCVSLGSPPSSPSDFDPYEVGDIVEPY